MDEPAPSGVAAMASTGAPWRGRYRAFICYSHQDEAIARRLHRRLEGYRVPSRLRGTQGEFGPLPDRLAPIFRDRVDLASSGELAPRILAALRDSEALLVICSPAAAASAWVKQEVHEFKRLGRGHRIYCLIVAGSPGDAHQECFVPALRFDLDAEGAIGNQPAEPLAADLRPGGDGWALAFLKLLSGLLGVDLDTLRQRESARRHRRMLAITAMAVLVMLVTSALAVQAMLARRDAERRQKQAEALVEFMLGDLNAKLNEVSRLDILESVDDHAMAYFKSLPVADVTDKSLAQRARAYIRIGDVRRMQGHAKQALEAFEAALALTRQLAQAQPESLPRQLALADNLTYIGITYWFQGDLTAAKRHFDAAHAVLDRARGFAGANTDLLYQSAQLDNNLGHVLEARGELAPARTAYQRMRDTMQALVARDADNVAWSQQLGLAHNNLGKLALLDGDLATATAAYRTDMDIQTRLARRNPRDYGQAERPLLAQAALGRTLALAGDLDGGIAQLRQALAGVQQLHDIDRTDTGFAEDVALYATQLARLLHQQGNVPQAQALIAQALEVLATLRQKDPENADWKREQAEALTERAALQSTLGHPARARPDAEAALRTLEPMLQSNPGNRSIVLAAVAARLTLAAATNDEGAAAALRHKAVATLKTQTDGQRDPRLLALQDRARQTGAGPARGPARNTTSPAHEPSMPP